jgi:hypothetical protein
MRNQSRERGKKLEQKFRLHKKNIEDGTLNYFRAEHKKKKNKNKKNKKSKNKNKKNKKNSNNNKFRFDG